MEVIKAIETRKSIRGYLPKPVPQELIHRILEIAVKAPSAINTQPWEFTVVTGEVLENIRKDNIETFLTSPKPHSNIYTGIYRERQVELAKDIFAVMGIKREDKAKRMEWTKRGFRFFDAPAAIIICIDESLPGTWPVFDCGIVAQTICLAATHFGLGTCIEDQGIIFEDVIKKHTGLPDSKRIIIGIAMGYPDIDFPANNLVSKREAVDKITNWHGF